MTTPTLAPHNLDAEVSVLGAILQDRDALRLAREILRPADFYQDAHRKVFNTCVDLFERNEPVDLVTLAHELMRCKQLAEIIGPNGSSGAAALVAFVDAVPTAANVAHHARIVKDLAGRRYLLEACLRTAERIRGNGGDLPGLLRVIREELTEAEDFSTARKNGLALTRIGELLGEQDEVSSWLVQDRLPAGGTSITAGKPKAGKSTLMRCLAVAVAKGESWLGFHVRHGTAIYLGLEEKRSEVRAHFRRLGVTPNDPLHVFLAPSPEDGLSRLRASAEQLHPALIVVDPLMKMVRVRDANDYAVVSRALEPFIALAHDTGAHLAAVHHLGKGDRSGGDAILGSTAIFAAVDTALLLKRGEHYRSLSSIQRYGPDLEEITVVLDQETGLVTDGPSRREVDETQAGKAILEFLSARGEPAAEPDVQEMIEGRKGVKARALRGLVEAGTITKTGAGKRGDPYLYSISGFSPPTISREPAGEKRKNDASPDEQGTYSGSHQNELFDPSGGASGGASGARNDPQEEPPLDEDRPPPESYYNDPQATPAPDEIPIDREEPW